MALLIAMHVLAVVVWVGGMFFAYFCLRPAAAKLLQPPTAVGGGRQIAVLADPDGNRIGLTHDSE